MAKLTPRTDNFIATLLMVSGRARVGDLSSVAENERAELLQAYASVHAAEANFTFDGETLGYVMAPAPVAEPSWPTEAPATIAPLPVEPMPAPLPVEPMPAPLDLAAMPAPSGAPAPLPIDFAPMPAASAPMAPAEPMSAAPQPVEPAPLPDWAAPEPAAPAAQFDASEPVWSLTEPGVSSEAQPEWPAPSLDAIPEVFPGGVEPDFGASETVSEPASGGVGFAPDLGSGALGEIPNEELPSWFFENTEADTPLDPAHQALADEMAATPEPQFVPSAEPQFVPSAEPQFVPSAEPQFVPSTEPEPESPTEFELPELPEQPPAAGFFVPEDEGQS